jgi:hypothetical protein
MAASTTKPTIEIFSFRLVIIFILSAIKRLVSAGKIVPPSLSQSGQPTTRVESYPALE